MKIIKRDGREVLFNGSKIAKAVAKANAEVSRIHQLNEFQIQAIADTVTKQCEKLPHIPSVEEVQDLVETAIMEMRGYEVAQKYVRYRYRRELARKANTTDDAILALIEQENEETGEKKEIPFLRYYRVFHISQCEGIAARHAKPLPQTARTDEAAERIIDAYL